ncbi:CRISPR system precrRNA processing endoribonuclease RAMP protein Cas6 [Paenibacillus spiritus]|uniref:CRISPR system precrRNA processing endoribonuclease RAMP protein Cas6 n=1 Tax=Paenibacillus spiritus TaxID=2496557 RepID=A0A5J5G9T9_9BACL|nr:CRISPR system precrRNA processing endoribonuclease RAMP protein Cas6 [Paenibacillus spiritus]KAA9004866.1 CRISPR system precrRNA processing endoribonuclease RAMP protein Cas6 [Paenibacillus spiritus]
MATLNQFQFLHFRALFTAREAGQLPPYLGSTLRGVLGHAMRGLVCSRPGLRCHLCELAVDCPYAHSFNSPGNEGGAVNPWVLYVPTRDKTSWQIGDSLIFELAVVGSATGQGQFYLDGIRHMERFGWGAKRMRFSLTQIMDPVHQSLIWSGGHTWTDRMKLSDLPDISRPASSVLIRFHTPLRLLVSRQLCRRPTFRDLIQSIARRISLLSQAYTQQPVYWDEEAMLGEAERVRTAEEDWRFVDLERYSMTYDRKLSLNGVEGWARYEGNITPFIPLLEAGRWLHAGKNATHGLGKYEVYYA